MNIKKVLCGNVGSTRLLGSHQGAINPEIECPITFVPFLVLNCYSAKFGLE